jgi:hypothetical protein
MNFTMYFFVMYKSLLFSITNKNIYFENFTMNNEYLMIKSYSITGYHWSLTTLFI